MANNVNSGSYAQYKDYDIIPYNCISYLMDNDEVIWKLLKYPDPDAWNKPNLTKTEKAALIYNGSDNTALYRVFMDRGEPDVNTFENCQIRIANYSIYPDNRVVGTMSVVFEVYPHYKTNHLSNYRTRGDMIMSRFIKVFNGASIGGIGKLFFDRVGSESNRQELGGQLPYTGKWMIMSNKSP